MEELIFQSPWVVVLIAIVCLGIYAQWKSDKEVEEINESSADLANSRQQSSTTETMGNDNLKNPMTWQLAVDTLREMNCVPQYSEDKNDNRIFFTFQEGHFFIEANDDSLYINIWYTYFHDVPLDDIDAMSNVRKAINMTNLNGVCINVYTMDKEDNRLAVHAKRNILFIKQIPDLKGYLASQLSAFFYNARCFEDCLHKLSEEYAHADS